MSEGNWHTVGKIRPGIGGAYVVLYWGDDPPASGDRMEQAASTKTLAKRWLYRQHENRCHDYARMHGGDLRTERIHWVTENGMTEARVWRA